MRRDRKSRCKDVTRIVDQCVAAEHTGEGRGGGASYKKMCSLTKNSFMGATFSVLATVMLSVRTYITAHRNDGRSNFE